MRRVSRQNKQDIRDTVTVCLWGVISLTCSGSAINLVFKLLTPVPTLPGCPLQSYESFQHSSMQWSTGTDSACFWPSSVSDPKLVKSSSRFCLLLAGRSSAAQFAPLVHQDLPPERAALGSDYSACFILLWSAVSNLQMQCFGFEEDVSEVHLWI